MAGLYLVTEGDYPPVMSDKKKCSQCGLVKSVNDFYPRPSRRSGRYSACKACLKLERDSRRETIRANGRAYAAQRRREHPDVIRAQTRKSVKAWNARHPEAKRQSQRDWYNSERGQRQTRNSAFKRRYGITLTEYEAMLASQGNKCAICQKTETARGTRGDRKPKLLSIDHDHDTGLIRGLLCARCNTAIGMLNHDPRLLDAAIVYLDIAMQSQPSGGM